jgi:hypothetical protein
MFFFVYDRKGEKGHGEDNDGDVYLLERSQMQGQDAVRGTQKKSS